MAFFSWQSNKSGLEKRLNTQNMLYSQLWNFITSVDENLLPIPLKQICPDSVANNICPKRCLTNFRLNNNNNKNTFALADITNIHNWNTKLDVRGQNSVNYYNNING